MYCFGQTNPIVNKRFTMIDSYKHTSLFVVLSSTKMKTVSTLPVLILKLCTGFLAFWQCYQTIGYAKDIFKITFDLLLIFDIAWFSLLCTHFTWSGKFLSGFLWWKKQVFYSYCYLIVHCLYSDFIRIGSALC